MQVGEVSEAVKAAEAGVDAVICQGFEAGGHIVSRVRLDPIASSSIDLISTYWSYVELQLFSQAKSRLFRFICVYDWITYFNVSHIFHCIRQ